MRLPLATNVKPGEVGPIDRERIVPGCRSVALVPIDERAALEFASLVLRELAERGRPSQVLIERSSASATSLPSALDVHGAEWRRVSAQDDSVLLETFRKGMPVLLIGTGLAARVDASFVLALTGPRLPPMIPPSFRALRPYVDAVIAEPRPAFAAWLAERLAERFEKLHP